MEDCFTRDGYRITALNPSTGSSPPGDTGGLWILDPETSRPVYFSQRFTSRTQRDRVAALAATRTFVQFHIWFYGRTRPEDDAPTC